MRPASVGSGCPPATDPIGTPAVLGDVHHVGDGVEGEAERIAAAEAPDSRPDGVGVSIVEGVVRQAGTVLVDAEDLPVIEVEVLYR